MRVKRIVIHDSRDLGIVSALILIQLQPHSLPTAMAVSVVDVRRGFVRSSLPEGVLRFPSADSSLLYVEDAVAVDAADVKANAQAGMAEAVFFSFTNLHQVR